VCQTVVAVDPAELDEAVAAKPNVTHVKAMLLDKTLDGLVGADAFFALSCLMLALCFYLACFIRSHAAAR
jgi:hypothetical protein